MLARPEQNTSAGQFARKGCGVAIAAWIRPQDPIVPQVCTGFLAHCRRVIVVRRRFGKVKDLFCCIRRPILDTLGHRGFLDPRDFRRRIQPSSWSAKATRHGSPIRPRPLNPQTSGTLQFRFWISVLVLPTTAFGPHFPVPPFRAYPSPTFSQSVPSALRTRRTSRNAATRLRTYSSGEGSAPI